MPESDPLMFIALILLAAIGVYWLIWRVVRAGVLARAPAESGD